MSRRRALMFVGQGSQHGGMARELWRQSKVARLVYEEADDVLGLFLSRMMRDGSDAELQQTENAQPALLTHCIAMWRTVQEHMGFRGAELEEGKAGLEAAEVALVMGHSVGEYTGMVANGALSLADGVRLVRERGLAMRAAVGGKEVGMRALLTTEGKVGMEAGDGTLGWLQELCGRYGEGGEGMVCSVANINSARQVVISGHEEAVKEVAAQAKKDKHILRATRLRVSAPFHCELMRPAADKVRAVLEDMEVRETHVHTVANMTGALWTDDSKLRDVLVGQITQPVLWRKSVHTAVQLGIQELVEIGPGGVLSSLLAHETALRVDSTHLEREADAVFFARQVSGLTMNK